MSGSKQRFNYWNESLLTGELPKPKKHRYLVFDVDQGGLNNIRMAFEYVVVLAAMTGRTLVIPPPKPWYLINVGPMPKELRGGTTEFKDIYNIDAVAKVIPVISTAEFIEEAATHLDIPDEFKSNANFEEKPGESQQAWRRWLLDNTDIPGWNPFATVVCLPDKDTCASGPHMTDKYLDSRTPVEFSAWMNAAPVLYFPSTKEHRSLGPVATMLAGADDTLPILGRRLIKHHVRYRDDIFNLASKIIDSLGLKEYDALQIRRNDFQYKKTRVGTDVIIDNVKILFDKKLPIYIATDEDRKEIFSVLGQGLSSPKIVTWQDVDDKFKKNLPYAWIGPIEQLICSQARRFVGNDLSTFTSYINRLRGYTEATDQNLYFHNQAYSEIPKPIQASHHRGRNYLRENPLFWLSC